MNCNSLTDTRALLPYQYRYPRSAEHATSRTGRSKRKAQRTNQTRFPPCSQAISIYVAQHSRSAAKQTPSHNAATAQTHPHSRDSLYWYTYPSVPLSVRNQRLPPDAGFSCSHLLFHRLSPTSFPVDRRSERNISHLIFCSTARCEVHRLLCRSGCGIFVVCRSRGAESGLRETIPLLVAVLGRRRRQWRVDRNQLLSFCGR
jgi:hypothetical protein